MTKVNVWKSECSYCKKELGTFIKKDDEKADKIYSDHIKNCKEYKKQNEQLRKGVKLVRELQDEGLSIKDITLLFSADDIGKDIKKLMKKFRINKEQLTDIIENI